MMKYFLMIVVLMFLMAIVACGDVEFPLNASSSSDIDGYIEYYKWFKWNDNTQSVNQIGYIKWGPEDPDNYYVYNNNDILVEVANMPVLKVILPIGVHYFALDVIDNGGLQSGIFTSNRLSLNPNDEWVTVTVIPRINRPPYIFVEAELIKQRNLMLLWRKQVLSFFRDVLNS